jgi:hypothetical protein
MHRTRLSLYYLAGYLLPTGLGLMLAPRLILRAMLSTGDYGEIFPSFAGVLMVALGMIVVQLIRSRADRLYPVTLAVRAVIWVWTLRLYLASGDPLFAIILGVVGLGMVITGTCYAVERRAAQASGA